ncbi:MAG: hypothetical protein LC659_11430, partial [Myxococcales bacterium]|nr:hypothetical protein [Myxococcales bacterium]
MLLIGAGILMDRNLERLARGMAQRVAPGSQVALELDLAVGSFALAKVSARPSGDGRAIEEAQ